MVCRVLIPLLVILLLAGCVSRVAVFSPRRPNTEVHRDAATRDACLECHQVSELRDHAAGDDCLRCHPICRGC